MTRFDKFQRSFQLIMAGICITLLEWTKGGFKELTQDLIGAQAHALVLVAFAAVLVILGIYLLEYLASLMIEHAQFLRRWIMGENFVEGVWVDIVQTHTSDDTTFSGGIFEIFFQGGELRVSGSSFDETGRKIGTFNSNFVHYADWSLSFHYHKGVWAAKDTPDGYSHYHFNPDKPRPDSFDGFYIPKDGASINRVVGNQLDPSVRKLTDKQKGEKVRDYIQDMRPGFGGG